MITNAVNSKQYVGQTTYSLKYRWECHLSAAKRGVNCALHHAIRKYGDESFRIKQIDSAESFNELNEKEAHHIIQCGTLAPSGYNLTTGGEGYRFSRETSLKISEAVLSRPSPSKETRKKISEALLGKIVSEKTRQKISQALTGRFYSEETLQRMSESQRGRKASEETRKKISDTNRRRTKKVCCKRGHLFNETNTYVPACNGQRVCLICRNLRYRHNKYGEELT